MKKTILVFKDNVHEYTITIEDGKKGECYALFPSDHPSWRIPVDQPLCKIIDTGNGIILDKAITKGKVQTYHDVEYLNILINYNYDNSSFPSEYKFKSE